MRLRFPTNLTPLFLAGGVLGLFGGCGGASGQGEGRFSYKKNAQAPQTPMPDWMHGLVVSDGKLCGFGVAGAGYDEHSPYPKRLSTERAVKNLAGVLHTRVQEAHIDRETLHGISVRSAKVLSVDDALLETVARLAETEFWLDVNGDGPYASKGFIYAHACIDASVAASTFEIDADALESTATASLVTPDDVPDWIDDYGTQEDGRLCAVGFSLPTFFADKTFQNVVEDVRWQLAEVLHTFVSSYYEELATTRGSAFESMTLATTEAISKGVIVTNYWHDRDGSGPVSKERSTYGFGCVYPVDVIASSAAKVEQMAPEDERKVIQQVRERAASAFDALDAEIEKREQEAQLPPPNSSGTGPDSDAPGEG